VATLIMAKAVALY